MKEVTSIKYYKSDVIGKHDSRSMSQYVLVVRDKTGHLHGDEPSLKYKSLKSTGLNEEMIINKWQTYTVKDGHTLYSLHNQGLKT